MVKLMDDAQVVLPAEFYPSVVGAVSEFLSDLVYCLAGSLFGMFLLKAAGIE